MVKRGGVILAGLAMIGTMMLLPSGAAGGAQAFPVKGAHLEPAGNNGVVRRISGGLTVENAPFCGEEGTFIPVAQTVESDLGERMKLARKLIKILGHKRNYEKRVDRAITLTFQDMKQKYVRNPKMIPVLREVLAEVRQDLLKRKREYFDLMAREYAKGMDKDVMAAAIKFYSSPQGQAFIKQNKMVRRRAKAVSREWVTSMIKKAMKDILRKARERGVPL